MFGTVASGPFPEILCSGCIGEFRPECAGPESEAQVVPRELVFADPTAGGIPAQPPAGAHLPVACGSEMALPVVEGFLFCFVFPEGRGRMGTDCGACDGEEEFILLTFIIECWWL